jgi:hypothetical protein
MISNLLKKDDAGMEDLRALTHLISFYTFVHVATPKRSVGSPSEADFI